MGGKIAAGIIFCVLAITVMSSEDAHALSYIALGDSFTSGEGDVSDDSYQFLDNPLSGICHLSSRSYPYIAAEILTDVRLAVHSVACSGARTIDIVGGGDYLGQGDRLIKGMETPNFEQISKLQVDALHTFRPGLTRQMVFIDYYRPDLVTVGIGGNDIGMVDKLKACMMPGTCDWAVDGNWDERAMAGREIKGLFDTLVSTYGYLKSRASTSFFFAVGYPKIINPDSLCNLSLNTMFNTSEKQFMNQAITYLNEVVESAAKASGFTFIPEEDAFRGNALCDITNTPAMNAIRFGDDIAPINAIGAFKLFGNESFHPTPYGHYLLSKAVAAAIDDRIERNQDPPVIDPQVQAPLASAYWHDDDRDLPRMISMGNMTSDSDSENQLVLTLPPYSFHPESQVKVLIHSEPRELCTVKASADGSFSLHLSLPSDLVSGFHRIIAKGADDVGNQVEYYKVFSHETRDSPPVVSMTRPPTTPPSEQSEVNIEASPSGTVSVHALVSPKYEAEVLGGKDQHLGVVWLWLGSGLVLVGVLGILYKLRKWI